MPEVILNGYLSDLNTFGQSFPDNTDIQRLKFINQYIDYVMNVEPRYKQLLRSYKMKGYEFGMLCGYKNQTSWHKSYKRYTYIRAIVTMIDKHEALLTRMNNPK